MRFDRRQSKGERARAVGTILLCYLLWVANSALALGTAAEVRAAYNRLGLALRWGQYTFTLVDEVGLIVLGLAWLVWILVMESRYRSAALRGPSPLLGRVTVTSAILVAIIALTGLVRLALRF